MIPAGQPAGYEAPTVANAGGELDLHARGSAVDDLYPTVGTTGGDHFGAITITPGDGVAPAFEDELSTIGGGNPYGAITITEGDAGPSVSATSGTIGPSNTSALDALGSLHGTVSDPRDILSQALLTKTINGIQATTAPWSSPISANHPTGGRCAVRLRNEGGGWIA
ncbi:MAG: hypothetical protein ABIP36_01195 [Acidimicrobiales bacterium]